MNSLEILMTCSTLIDCLKNKISHFLHAYSQSYSTKLGKILKIFIENFSFSLQLFPKENFRLYHFFSIKIIKVLKALVHFNCLLVYSTHRSFDQNPDQDYVKIIKFNLSLFFLPGIPTCSPSNGYFKHFVH